MESINRNEQGRGLAERVSEAREEERSRLSREVHDGVLQSIIGSRLVLRSVLEVISPTSSLFEELTVVEECLAQATKDGRRLMEELRSVRTDEMSLVEAVQLYLVRMQAQTGIKLEFVDLTDGIGLGFPSDLRSNLYRVVQEGVRNVMKHSQSDRARVTVGQHGEHAWAQVEDWGMGFSPHQIERSDDHTGLASLRERAELLGGVCELESAPGQGCSIKVTAPLVLATKDGFPDLELEKSQLRNLELELECFRASCRDLCDSSSIGYLELDTHDRIAYSNPALCCMIGRAAQDLLNHNLDCLLGHGTAAEWGTKQSCEVRLKHPDLPDGLRARLDKRAPFGHRQLIAVTPLAV